jgi:L-asparaginase II
MQKAASAIAASASTASTVPIHLAGVCRAGPAVAASGSGQ